MVPHSAVCILATKTRAWVNTLLGSASQFHGTVRVELTLRSAVWWLADHASLAGAVTTVPIVAGRVGERTAGVRVARIRLLSTTVVLADVAVPTIGVNNTLRTAASDGVGLGDEVRETPTDGGVVMVGGTGCARTAG